MLTASLSSYECAWVTSPTAGQTITSFSAAATSPGLFTLGVEYGYVGGVLGAPEQTTSGGNFQLFLGNNQIGNQSDGFLNAPPVLNVMNTKYFLISLDGATSIYLVANQAGTAAVKYAGALWLTPVYLAQG